MADIDSHCVDLLERAERDGVRVIPLTRGQFTVVDASDYACLVAMGSWQLKAPNNCRSAYATHGARLPTGAN